MDFLTSAEACEGNNKYNNAFIRHKISSENVSHVNFLLFLL